MIRNKCGFISIISNDDHELWHGLLVHQLKCALVHGTEYVGLFLVRVVVDPFTDGVKVLALTGLKNLANGQVLKVGEDTSVNRASGAIALQFVEDSTPVGKVLLDDGTDNGTVILNTFLLENHLCPLEELGSQLRLAVLGDDKVDD